MRRTRESIDDPIEEGSTANLFIASCLVHDAAGKAPYP
jgi:hypothetical protein